ncbi:conserved hypothetical protein [Verticillium alfalfae VaMs.102]|uniref:Uncharacterized protein n=1 Tax=Verticillium alfalfae (strain VaMs.102 / ATCC MYA-4576 / FGSC 10136) TaxID=526221 RepID=C9SVU0_VERA1|nr:conserved hypothetical protein [Verticillium alfalfae VaMs.102]EEY22905.1 conserved hypothetical protein [Verticillium alfalfae VaMs.102]
MAAAIVHQIPTGTFGSLQSIDNPVQVETSNAPKQSRHDVETSLNYFKPNEDGSPPHPTYVDRPETYDRPFESHKVTVEDISGREAEFSLDSNGFQIHRHTAQERDFLDDDQIKASYYLETEQLLKDVSLSSTTPSAVRPLTQSRKVERSRPVQRVHIDQSYAAVSDVASVAKVRSALTTKVGIDRGGAQEPSRHSAVP